MKKLKFFEISSLEQLASNKLNFSLTDSLDEFTGNAKLLVKFFYLNNFRIKFYLLVWFAYKN